ncbi:Fpg/Nei family DNA glycosylase [Luteipulveratus halotolerans]|uniref:DNA-(apurinic or apyrimidinic site) lyase n=1 Tax=Luteipulveratus halotolerans TaxID=1631356 RepID=A0A0L6CKH1_9MICO|nr:DNA-formamidopyrimidine glycosylase family protein [Luteipulveratus halotolerans]KNX38296.1 DNA glycosylase [Luteipulveratus halotolerans]
MPEGHVVHRIAGEITRSFGGRPVRSTSPQGRFSDEAALFDGHLLDHAEAYGKQMFVRFEGIEQQVNIHLGLIGKFFFTAESAPPVVGEVRWRLSADEPPMTMDLRGATVVAVRSPAEVAAIVHKLGPDPLRSDADPEVAWERIRRSRKAIGALMMEQTIFAGVGNIYRAEVLYRQRIDPFMQGRFLRRGEFEAMWDDLVELMPLGVRDGRIDTVLPEHTPEAMGRPARVDKHGGEVYVYRREGLPCLVCETPVSRTEMAARNLFWCRHCQPRSRRRKPS